MSGCSGKLHSVVRLVEKYSFFIILTLPLLVGVIAELRSSGKVLGGEVKPAAAQESRSPRFEPGGGIYGVNNLATASQN